MIVKLINSSNDEKIAQIAAAICVGQENRATEKNLDAAVNSGHLSVLEHLTMTFLITGISRACSHQLVRHRVASYSQQSQRYCDIETNNIWFVPPKFNTKEQECAFLDVMQNIEITYEDLRDMWMTKEDARSILPNATKTNILITVNARAFIEQCNKRLCNKAQDEIRELYAKMKETIKQIYPTVYKLCNPPCRTGKCPESKPCGKYWQQIEFDGDSLEKLKEIYSYHGFEAQKKKTIEELHELIEVLETEDMEPYKFIEESADVINMITQLANKNHCIKSINMAAKKKIDRTISRITIN